MDKINNRDPDALRYAIKRSCENKAEVVKEDEKEAETIEEDIKEKYDFHI